MKRFLDFGFIQDRIGRTLRRCGIFTCVQRGNITIDDSGNAMDGLGEVIPTDDSFIGEVINTRLHTLLYGCQDRNS